MKSTVYANIWSKGEEQASIVAAPMSGFRNIAPLLMKASMQGIKDAEYAVFQKEEQAKNNVSRSNAFPKS